MASCHHTGLTVRDLDRSLAFYRDVLGMEVLFEQEKQGGYLAAIVGYPEAHVRMAHLAFPGDGHRVELFQYVAPEPRGEPGEPRNVGITETLTTSFSSSSNRGRRIDEAAEQGVCVTGGVQGSGRAIVEQYVAELRGARGAGLATSSSRCSSSAR